LAPDLEEEALDLDDVEDGEVILDVLVDEVGLDFDAVDFVYKTTNEQY